MPTPTFTFHDETWLKGYAASGCLQLTDMSETKMMVATAAFQVSANSLSSTPGYFKLLDPPGFLRSFG